MAKKSKRQKQSARKLSARNARVLTARQVKTLRANITELRRHFTGFSVRAGYSTSKLNLSRMSPAKMAVLKHRARELHREQSAPYKIVRPKSAAAKRALYKHTGAEVVKGRKTFLVHVAEPDRTAVELVGSKSRKRVRVVRKVAGGRVEQQYFYFADYGKRAPKTMVQIRRVAARMLKDMPRGYYVMLSKRFGNISVSMDRDDLLDAIERDWLKYDIAPDPFSRDTDSRGLAGSLIGFVKVSTTETGADTEYAKRLSQRQRMRVAADSGKSVFRRRKRRGWK